MGLNLHDYVFSEPYLGWLLRGALFTAITTVMTSLLACAAGIPMGFWRETGHRFGRRAAALYITAFRNLPMVPFLLFTVFAIPGWYLEIIGDPFPPGNEYLLLVAAISLNTSAHVADIFRSGLRAIPPEQHDAARTLGLSTFATRMLILAPQALRIAAPALTTRLTHNMKNSSLAVLLPLSVDTMELIGQTARIAGQTFAWAEPLLFSTVAYLLFTALFALLVKIVTRISATRSCLHELR